MALFIAVQSSAWAKVEIAAMAIPVHKKREGRNMAKLPNFNRRPRWRRVRHLGRGRAGPPRDRRQIEKVYRGKRRKQRHQRVSTPPLEVHRAVTEHHIEEKAHDGPTGKDAQRPSFRRAQYRAVKYD